MSDKIVNVYVGECFQEGGQAGGEGKTYGLSLSGNKLKLVENGQQSEVDLPAGGGGGVSDKHVEAFNQLMYMLAKVQYDPEKIFSSPAGQYTLTLSGDGSIDTPYTLNVVIIDKELSPSSVSISDVYNIKWQFLKDSPSTSNLFTKKVNILYDDTLVNKDGSIDNLDLSKLPQDIRAFNLTVTPV
jgi:hypothetical protein|nr:MAG TPA: hypothetical protein [Caudoviricetes sp.]